MSEHIIVTTDTGVMEIKFNRADKRNALTQRMHGAAAEDPAINTNPRTD
jgi:enoyl-CoA hydratase/carnithine racemase